MELFESARKVLLVPFALVSLFFAVEMCSSKPRERALVTSGIVLFEFGVQIAYYTFLALGWGLSYQNQRCYDYRPIYATRWIGWSFGIPTLIFMNLYPVDNRGAVMVLARLCPQMVASAAYCWICFLGCVVVEAWLGWTLNLVGCLAYIIVVVDEVCFVSDNLLTTSMPALKGYSIIIKETVFIVYTAAWLMGNGSFVSSFACQRFYTVSDISLKATMASLLFLDLMCGRQENPEKGDE
eukprot:Skav231800  [mRNA]  locus=scaffold668:2382:3098:- [translate_table: standard]